MSVGIFLAPHTHWDRERYEPFQRFRLRLIDLMDDLIARAQAPAGRVLPAGASGPLVQREGTRSMRRR
jgi:hypothetical protein